MLVCTALRITCRVLRGEVLASSVRRAARDAAKRVEDERMQDPGKVHWTGKAIKEPLHVVDRILRVIVLFTQNPRI
jgi:hypothetical protein